MARLDGWDAWQVFDNQGRRKYLSADERTRFLAAADLLALPRHTLCYVLAYTGCRISEALALTTHHVDAEQLTVTFRTLKRRRTVFRTVPVPKPVVGMLRKLANDSGGQLWRMHRVTAWRVVKATMIRAGIAGPMACCKGPRRGFGIRAAGRSVPINLVQRWMGHASPNTTAIYLDAVGFEERQFASRMW